MAVQKGRRCPGIGCSAGLLAAGIVAAVVVAPIAMAADSAKLAAAHQALQSGKYAAAIKAADAAFEAGGLSGEQTARGLYIRGSARLARKQPGEAIADLNAALWTGKLPARLKTRAVEKRNKAYSAAGIRTPLPLAGRTAAAANSWAALPKTTATVRKPSHKVSLPAPRSDRLPDGFKTPARPIVSVGRRDDWSSRATASVPATTKPTAPRQPAAVRQPPAPPQYAAQWQSATHRSLAPTGQNRARPRSVQPVSPAWPSATRTVLNQPARSLQPPVRTKTATPQWNSSVRASARQSTPPRPTAPTRTSFTTVSKPAASQLPAPARTPQPKILNPTVKPVVQSPARPKPVAQPVLANFTTKTEAARSAVAPRSKPVRPAPVQRQPVRTQIVRAAPPRVAPERAQPTPPRTTVVAQPAVPRPPAVTRRPAPRTPPASGTTAGSYFGGLFGMAGGSKPDHISAADELQRRRTERIRAHNRRLRDGGAGQAPAPAQ